MYDKSISVFLPAYNEEDSIGGFVLEVNSYLKDRFRDFEILVISEGSTDRTKGIVMDLELKIPRLRLLAKNKNSGYAGALRTGFKNSTKELIFYTDGDHQYDIRELDELMPLIDRYDIVTGYKIKRNDPLMRSWMSWLYNITMKLLFNLKVKDVNCAFKLYRRQVIDKVDFLPDLTQGVINAEVYLTALRHGYTIAEVPVHHFARTGGKSGAESGLGIALVRFSVIKGFLRDTLLLWRKFNRL